MATAGDPPKDPPKHVTVGAVLDSGSVYHRKAQKERSLKGNTLACRGFVWDSQHTPTAASSQLSLEYDPDASLPSALSKACPRSFSLPDNSLERGPEASLSQPTTTSSPLSLEHVSEALLMQSVAPSPLPLEPALKAYGTGSPHSTAATAGDPPEDPPKGMTVDALLG